MSPVLRIGFPDGDVLIPIKESILDFQLGGCDRVFADDPSYSRSAIEALPLIEAIEKTTLMLYNHPAFNPQRSLFE